MIGKRQQKKRGRPIITKERKGYLESLVDFKRALEKMQQEGLSFESSHAYDLLELIDTIHFMNANEDFLIELKEGLQTIVYCLEKEIDERGR